MASSSFLRVLFAIWAIMMVAAAAQTSGRIGQQPAQPVDGSISGGSSSGGFQQSGGNDCPKGVGTVCPHNGKVWHYCKSGKADGGCRSKDDGPFPKADCGSQCLFQVK